MPFGTQTLSPEERGNVWMSELREAHSSDTMRGRERDAKKKTAFPNVQREGSV